MLRSLAGGLVWRRCRASLLRRCFSHSPLDQPEVWPHTYLARGGYFPLCWCSCLGKMYLNPMRILLLSGKERIWLIWGDVAGGFTPLKMHVVELHSLATISKESQKKEKKILVDIPRCSHQESPKPPSAAPRPAPSNDLVAPLFPTRYHG